MADSLESFQWTTPFHKFTLEDYERWKQARSKDPRPLRPCEPVAFFELDERLSLTVDIDFKRSCRYIMLKPTGFRSKPHHFRQSVNDLPMELEFFGALGSSRPTDPAADFCSQNDPSSTLRAEGGPLLSGHSVVIQDLDTGEELLTLDAVQLSHLRLGQLPLASKHALSSGAVEPVGQAVIRVSDSRLSLRTLRGLSVRIQRSTQVGSWRLRGASLVGVITQAGQLPALDRSYLISPEHFPVVNEVLAKMVFDGTRSRVLTASIMEFLTKLVAHDYHFAALILEAVDLRKFIEVNFLTNDQAHIQASVEFLRCFQSEPRFARGLFEILVDILQSVLPHNVPPQRGYEALVGMLSWALPLDVEQALGVLYSTLYRTICCGCLPSVQTPEYVGFRTRPQPVSAGETRTEDELAGHFPFDGVLLRPHSQESRSAAEAGTISKDGGAIASGSQLPNSASLLKDVVIEASRLGSCQTFVAKFGQQSAIRCLQLFFSHRSASLYALDVYVSVNGSIVYHQALGESTFARYVRYKRTGQSTKDGEEPAD